MKLDSLYTLTYTDKELASVADFLYSLFPKCSLFAFSGTLGAGKTTLIKYLLKKAGVSESIVSPTFSYVLTYKNKKNQLFHHFDLYRLQTADDFTSAGFGELLEQENSWSFIEWPEIIEHMLKNKTCFISLEYIDDYTRRLTCAFSHDSI